MPVPIPLNECIVLVSGRLLWGTCHTPFGTARPCVGQIEFAKWRVNRPQDGTYELLDARKQVVVSLVPLSALHLTLSRANRLRRVQSRHQIRAAANASYARRWARKFREVNNTHLSSE
jgi:hypothetical protein